MPAHALLDQPERSAATVGASPVATSAFSDATVWRPSQTYPATHRQILVHETPGQGRRLLYGVEIVGSPAAPIERWQRLEAVLARINELLAPSHADSDPVTFDVVEAALPVVTQAIVEADAESEVFPLADGGLLFRWQTQHGSVEVEFDTDGDAVLLIDDQIRHERRAGQLAELWSAAVHWLAQP